MSPGFIIKRTGEKLIGQDMKITFKEKIALNTNKLSDESP